MTGDNARLVDELRASRFRIAAAAARERWQLEQDLHDGAQQRLVSLQINLQMAIEQTEDQRLAQRLEGILADAEQGVEELRALARGIYPPVLSSYGIAAALKAFASATPIPVRVLDGGVGRLPRTIEAAVYFCATEAVQNAIEHAGDGARVTITLGTDGEGVQFAIADDGVGMADPASCEGEGLVGMRDRIGAVGGELDISASPGAGTTVRGSVPVER